MSKFQNDAIFWVDIEKVDPNPYQPRRDFNEESLRDLAESIRQYGVLQPLTVTRNEETKDDGGLRVKYELIAGERRLRAAKMANLSQVPVTIRDQKEDDEVKLELAIIENLQREDLNPIERAQAFDKLAEKFDFTHKEIAEKIGKSREYVSNSMRLLKLPEEAKKAVMSGKIAEGHARPILMLRDDPEKQKQLFQEIIRQDLTVRESEKRARRDAQDKVRKKENKIDPETKALEEELSDTLGTRVQIEKKEKGGKLVIDFFSEEDLEELVEMVKSDDEEETQEAINQFAQAMNPSSVQTNESGQEELSEDGEEAESEQPSRKLEKSTEAANPGNQPQASKSGPATDTDDERLAETLGSMINQAREQQEAAPPANGDTDSQNENELSADADTDLQSSPKDTTQSSGSGVSTNSAKGDGGTFADDKQNSDKAIKKDDPQPEQKRHGNAKKADDPVLKEDDEVLEASNESDPVDETGDDVLADSQPATDTSEDTSKQEDSGSQDGSSQQQASSEKEGEAEDDEAMYSISNFSV